MCRTVLFCFGVAVMLSGCDTTVPVVASGGISLTNQQVAPPAYMPGTVLDERFMRSVREGG